MKSILQEAVEIRSGERKADYGDAVESFDRVAEIFGVMSGRSITAADCALVLMAVKIARERHAHKRDNLVDLCGYADIYHLIRERDLTAQNEQ